MEGDDTRIPHHNSFLPSFAMSLSRKEKRNARSSREEVVESKSYAAMQQ
jgi:hypothetical protein